MRLLVCGNRGWTCRETIRAWLERFPACTTVIHGAARGADEIAGNVARELGYCVEEYPADWNRHGRAAGPIRNRDMAAQRIDRAIAFGQLGMAGKHSGTCDMVFVLAKCGILVTVVPRPGVLP